VVCASAGFTKAGMPIGMQLIAPPRDEATALRAGHAFQRATDWHLRAPPPFTDEKKAPARGAGTN
jgi:Asp-tRNA(Asn)/Glu-tRNA(Gln) amidotransferase A subunit family amidase